LIVLVATIVAGAGVADAGSLKPADIIWVIDTSGSMDADIADIKSRFSDFHTAMTTAGIDANYGLVEFGGTSGNGSTSGTAALRIDVTDYGTFIADPKWGLLSAAGGGDERGSTATSVALGATFRSGSVINIILVTDEDDDSDGFDNLAFPGTRLALGAADSALTAGDALFNFIGVPGDGNTDWTYGVLAANHGGTAFDILSYRTDGDPFFDNFVATKVEEIITASSVPLPGAAWAGFGLLGLLGATRRFRRRRA
jgi:hypothetical protein